MITIGNILTALHEQLTTEHASKVKIKWVANDKSIRAVDRVLSPAISPHSGE
jgi:hypothetical protein